MNTELNFSFPDNFYAILICSLIKVAIADDEISWIEKSDILQIVVAGERGSKSIHECRKILQRHVELFSELPETAFHSLFESARGYTFGQKVEILLSALSIARSDAPYSLREIRTIVKIATLISVSSSEVTTLIQGATSKLEENGINTGLLKEKLRTALML